MRILLISPLYPPDIADPAPYVKELATRLKENHEVTILSYNHLPEQIDGVHIVTVEKNKMLPVRLFRMLRAVVSLRKQIDVIYVQNGPSTELPVAIASFIIKAPYILRLGDEKALRFAEKQFILRMIQSFAIRRAKKNIAHDQSVLEIVQKICKDECAVHIDRPHTRPEIMPLAEYPKFAFDTYESSWNSHISQLEKVFDHARS